MTISAISRRSARDAPISVVDVKRRSRPNAKMQIREFVFICRYRLGVSMIRIDNLEVYIGVLVFRETTRRGEQKQREPAGSRSVGPLGFGFWVSNSPLAP